MVTSVSASPSSLGLPPHNCKAYAEIRAKHLSILIVYSWFIIGFDDCLCEMEHNEQSNKERSYNWNLNKFLLYVYMSDVISNFIDVEVPIWANFFLYCIVQYNCKAYVSFILLWHTYTSLTSLAQSIKCLFDWICTL